MAAPEPARPEQAVWRRASVGQDVELDPEKLRDLARRFARRERAAFEGIFRLFKGAIYAIGVVELGDASEAEDLVQETFRRAWTAAPSLNEPEKIRPWLYAIARNLCVDLKETQRRRPQVLETLPDAPAQGSLGSPLHAAVRSEAAQKLRALLGSVPEQFRTILAMRLLEERSYQEIAGILDVPLHFVKNAIARGGRILLEKVRNHPDLGPQGER